MITATKVRDGDNKSKWIESGLADDLPELHPPMVGLPDGGSIIDYGTQFEAARINEFAYNRAMVRRSLLLLALTCICSAQDSYERLAEAVKLWAHIKYLHPYV